jgi:hypothetical protein
MSNRVQDLALFYPDLMKLKDVLASFRNFVYRLGGSFPSPQASQPGKWLAAPARLSALIGSLTEVS